MSTGIGINSTLNYQVYDNGNITSYQQAWAKNVTACGRPAADLGLAYIAIAGSDADVKEPRPPIEMFPVLEECCRSKGSIYSIRAGCPYVYCYSNDTAEVQEWRNCTGRKLPNLDQQASKIDYNYLQSSIDTRKKASSAAARGSSSLASIIFACVVASVVTSGL